MTFHKSLTLTARSMATVLLYMQLASCACAENIRVDDWKPRSYVPMTASVGDTVTFTWPRGYHNVYAHPTGSCSVFGSTLVGYDPGATYTFAEPGMLAFACHVGNNCRDGQIVW